MLRPIFYSRHLGRSSVQRSWTHLRVHCEYKNKSTPTKGNAEMVYSKSSPPPSTYDEPGKPFDAVLKATRCSADSTAVWCLKEVPSEVYFSHYLYTCPEITHRH